MENNNEATEQTESASTADISAAEKVKKALEFLQDFEVKQAEHVGYCVTDAVIEQIAFLQILDRAEYLHFLDRAKKAKANVAEIKRRLNEVIEKTDKRRKTPAQPEQQIFTPITDFLPDCPLPTLVMPSGYAVFEGELIKRYTDKKTGEALAITIARAPVLITGRLTDIDEGTTFLKLSWKRCNGTWRNKIVDRGVALNSKKLIDLATDDFPVNSNNSGELVIYLDALEAVNFNKIPCQKVSSHMGWQGQNFDGGFLWGRTLINARGEIISNHGEITDSTIPSDWREDWVSFQPASSGDDQLANGYTSEGTWDGWLDAIKNIKFMPRALLALYASFVPPLLQIIDAPNFVISWDNRTSTGKTTVLRLAASVWGKPDYNNGILLSWDNTRVALERSSGVVGNLPLLLDDTKTISTRDPRQIANMLYEVSQGRGRGRGNLKGLARTRTWRTVLLSSGESPITSFTQDGGTRARVIEVRGLPFDNDKPDTRRIVTQLTSRLLCNYGHAGPKFISGLIKHRSEWPKYKLLYHEYVEELAGRANGPEGGRLAHYGAAITLSALLAHDYLKLPWHFDLHDPLKYIWESILAQAENASGEERALADVYSWAVSNQESFWGREVSTGGEYGSIRIPPQGWAGYWDESDKFSSIDFLPHKLEEILRNLKYEPEAIIGGWKEKGWLDCDKGRNQKSRRDKGAFVRVYRIKRGAFDTLV